MMDNQNLLAEYVQTGSDAAFRELVNRYVDLVHSTALRLVEGDTHRAEDVAQTVFVDLTRMARTLSNDVMLGGWLHRHTCFVAANTMRGERRRRCRERQAVEMNALQNNSGAGFSLVAPILDEAINELGEADRQAVLLRFFEQHDFRSLGQALGSTEDAARMRVTRALDKLQVLLKRRGVTTSSASLSVVLSANAVQAAPAGLAITIFTAAAVSGTTIANVATATAAKAIAMTTLQKTLIAATITVLAGAGIYEARHAVTLQSQVQTLQQQQAPLDDHIQQLQSERDDAANRLSALADENARAKGNSSELLRLRGEVSRLRNEAAAAAIVAKEAKDFQSEMMQVFSNTPPIRTFVATTLATVPWGQAIFTGGWKTPSGKRAIVLTTLQPEGEGDGQRLTINSKVLEYTEDAGKSLGLAQYNIDGQSSAKTQKLSADQLGAILNAAKDNEGVEILAAPSVITMSGRQAQVQIVDMHQTASGEKYTTGPVLNFIPTISPDGQSVQMVIVAQLNYPIRTQQK